MFFWHAWRARYHEFTLPLPAPLIDGDVVRVKIARDHAQVELDLSSIADLPGGSAVDCEIGDSQVIVVLTATDSSSL